MQGRAEHTPELCCLVHLFFQDSDFRSPSPTSHGVLLPLPLVSREWKNGSNSSSTCTPFLHSQLTKGRYLRRP